MTKNNQTVTIDPLLVPDSQLALKQFQSHGGHITEFSSFGHDPLEGNLELFRQRESKFLERYSDFGPFFHKIVNGDYSFFHDGLLYFIDVSKQLASTMDL